MANGKNAGAEVVKLTDPELVRLVQWGKFAKASGVIPPTLTTWQAMAIIQTGKELGLLPMQALRGMHFVNGRLSLDVQVQLALAKRNGGVVISDLQEGDGWCEVELKKGEEKVRCKYTREMASKAGLTGKDNYKKYERQMLRWRASGDALRLIDPASSMLSPEEAESISDPLPVPGSIPDIDLPEGKEVEAAGITGQSAPPAEENGGGRDEQKAHYLKLISETKSANELSTIVSNLEAVLPETQLLEEDFQDIQKQAKVRYKELAK